ncbi:hypothetical protein D3C85_731600 [compost metagenome]
MRPAVPELTQQAVGFKVQALELDPRLAPGLVHGRQHLPFDACAYGVYGKQADALFASGSGLACGNDQQVGAVTIEHMLEGAVEGEPVAFGHHRCLDIVGGPAIGTAERQGRGHAAIGNRRQPALLLFIIGRQQQRRGGHAGGGEKRRAQQTPAHLFQQDRQLDKAEAQAPIGFGDMNGRPVHFLAQTLPEGFVETPFADHCRAHGGRIRDIGEETLGRCADHFLFVAECKLHRGAFCSFGGARVAPPL